MLGLSHPLSSRISLASVVPTAPKRHPINGAESFGIKHLPLNQRHKENPNIIGGQTYELWPNRDYVGNLECRFPPNRGTTPY
jgi:hypothetical protein